MWVGRPIRRASDDIVGTAIDVLQAGFAQTNHLSSSFSIRQIGRSEISVGIDKGMSGAAS